MKSYELVSSSYTITEGVLGSDTPGLPALRVVIIKVGGVLLANQAEALFTIAIGSNDAKALAAAITEYANGVPTPQEQLEGVK